MKTRITSKYQTTIPKKIREQLHLSVHDSLDWRIEKGRIIVRPVQSDFLSRRNTIKTGKGDIADDINKARIKRSEKYR